MRSRTTVVLVVAVLAAGCGGKRFAIPAGFTVQKAEHTNIGVVLFGEGTRCDKVKVPRGVGYPGRRVTFHIVNYCQVQVGVEFAFPDNPFAGSSPYTTAQPIDAVGGYGTVGPLNVRGNALKKRYTYSIWVIVGNAKVRIDPEIEIKDP